MSKKFKYIIIIIILIFCVLAFVQLNKHTQIPDHIHSIDDKEPEQRTDVDNITILERDLQKDPDNINTMLKLVDIYINTNNADLARKYLLKILEIDPSNIEALKRLEKIK